MARTSARFDWQRLSFLGARKDEHANAPLPCAECHALTHPDELVQAEVGSWVCSGCAQEAVRAWGLG